MASIAVIGTGYVGLVSGACLADFGNTVTCVDVDEKKIEGLRAGQIPIFEPGLSDVVARNVAAERLSFTTDASRAIQAAKVIFIAVGTPPSDDGSADLRYVEEAARTIGRMISDLPGAVSQRDAFRRDQPRVSRDDQARVQRLLGGKDNYAEPNGQDHYRN